MVYRLESWCKAPGNLVLLSSKSWRRFQVCQRIGNSGAGIVVGRQGLAQPLSGRDGFEGAAHDQARAHSIGIVAEAMFEKLGVGENDAELVVQPVEQPCDFGEAGFDGEPSWLRGFRRHG